MAYHHMWNFIHQLECRYIECDQYSRRRNIVISGTVEQFLHGECLDGRISADKLTSIVVRYLKEVVGFQSLTLGDIAKCYLLNPVGRRSSVGISTPRVGGNNVNNNNNNNDNNNNNNNNTNINNIASINNLMLTKL